ncbi:BolA family transcriptional regulator [Sphingomonas lacunae]|uniref:BolA family transcriptional regulator n=1 Tax=Sphingomonas lacunae TaxID=2698828 RepID=A0A6M4AYS0_9SPHN|nr:BolA family protein [Sphingomonas lacunae]QJQ33500.1 BolA family transcriptional regulator [Sphingomonas lacunae]
MNQRLAVAFPDARFSISNDSAMHSGHMGDNGTGESHFSLTIESPAFAGLNRVARQRLVNHALAELLKERVHALTIRATAPGE